ncbi:MAG: MATE family efflux transporter [Oscillospiraceae bacterium]|jgi:putative MATE family efflux protein|nr:MATE family efflux transporter [Oscillospiraceae bacterium]
MSGTLVKGKSHGLDLTQGRVPTLLLRFAWPFLVSGLISALYGVADTFVIGKYGSEAAISGVGTATQVLNFVYTATIGIGTGGTVLIGRKIGERDDKGAAKAVGSFMTIGAILMVVLTAFIFFMRDPLIAIMKAPADSVAHAVTYVNITVIGVPFLIGFNFISAIQRGMGNSKNPSIVGAIGCFTNIILDFVFAGGLGMGAFGVALATVIAQAVTFIVIGGMLLKNKFPFAFTKKDFRLHKPSVSAVFRVGIPLWAQEIVVHISFMIIQGVVNNMGTDASASVTLISKVFNIGGMFPLAIGSAIAAMSAQNLGAGRRDRALSALKWGILYSLIIEVVFCAWCQIAPSTITSQLAPGKEGVILGAASYLRAFSIDLVLIGLVFPINSFLSGLGKAFVTMTHSLASTFLVRVPLSLLFSRIAGDLNTKLYFVGLAAPIASVLSLIICFVYITVYFRRLERTEERLPVPAEAAPSATAEPTAEALPVAAAQASTSD